METTLKILPETKPEELDYQLAYNAHRGTSFSPEVRAKSHQQDFAETLNKHAETFEKLIKADTQKEIAISEFERFKQKYKALYISWLSAKSRCLSTMITGGSNFPVRQAEKANISEHKRSLELSEFEDKAISAIIKKIKGLLPQEIRDDETWQSIKKEIYSSISTVIGIHKGELHYSKPLITGALKRFITSMYKNRQYIHVNKALDEISENEKKYNLVIFAKNNPIWDFRKEPEKIEEILKKENKSIFKNKDLEVLNNYEIQRVQLLFNGKPSQEIINYLKSKAFKWSPSNMAWQRQLTNNAIYEVKYFLEKFHKNDLEERLRLNKVGSETTQDILIAEIESESKLKLLLLLDIEPEQSIIPSKTAKVIDMPVKSIHTDEKRFQNRTNSFSSESKDRIVKAVENKTFDWAKFDPIIIWLDPKTGTHFVLSGHSRLAAFKQLSKKNENFDDIPVKIFEGTEAQAIDLALNSNTLSTKETEVERAMYYNKKRTVCEISKSVGLLGAISDCEKLVETECKEAEGKNSNYILNLSHLNRDGFLMESLNKLGIEKDNDSTNVLRTIANWIGEARRQNKDLLNVHETEIAKFLLNGGYGNKTGQFKNKTQFNERLKYSFDKWKASGADETRPLNLANTLSKSSFEKDFDSRLLKAKTEMDQAVAEHQEKHTKFLFALMEKKIDQKRFDELMKPVVSNVNWHSKEYERIMGQKWEVKQAATAQTSLFGATGFFGTIYKQFKKKPKEAIKHLMKVKEGECTNALYRDDIGYIDIVWGENDKENKGFGLKHIIEKHGKEIKELGFEVEDFIPIVVQYGEFNEKKSESDKKVFESKKFRFVIAIDKKRVKRWLLTAFDLRKK